MGNLAYLICVAVASFAVLVQPAGAQGANTTLPLTYPGQVLRGDGSQTCPSETQRGITRSEVKNATQRLLRESVVPLLQLQTFSCGGSTGWRRVAYLNMSDPSQQCPSVWQEITTPHRVCGRRSNIANCEGLNYTTGSVQYDQVCGRIIGYQVGALESFPGSGSQSINTYYVDGVSVTYGYPRQHIWSFACGVDETNRYSQNCPCVTGSTVTVPSFVGQNYFCESGLTRWNGNFIFHSNGDPLWDGQGCGPNSSCCTLNSPPWFSVTLPSPTTDNIEVRLCTDEAAEQTPIQLMELYVK